ncbi:hypothetical protein BDD12DRAFT_215597 [Trichophaea hybrida]|nr:hypothetical protein BDD12DRAFT_215597 [Trichophaea hybrida]
MWFYLILRSWRPKLLLVVGWFASTGGLIIPSIWWWRNMPQCLITTTSSTRMAIIQVYLAVNQPENLPFYLVRHVNTNTHRTQPTKLNTKTEPTN